jgi:hypothetical protein
MHAKTKKNVVDIDIAFVRDSKKGTESKCAREMGLDAENDKRQVIQEKAIFWMRRVRVMQMRLFFGDDGVEISAVLGRIPFRVQRPQGEFRFPALPVLASPFPSSRLRREPPAPISLIWKSKGSSSSRLAARLLKL